jgi:hypothetical protein
VAHRLDLVDPRLLQRLPLGAHRPPRQRRHHAQQDRGQRDAHRRDHGLAVDEQAAAAAGGWL